METADQPARAGPLSAEYSSPAMAPTGILLFFKSVLISLLLPFVLLNWFGVFVSGIWLLALGDWRDLGLGVVAFLVSRYLLGFALIPEVAAVAAAVHCAKKGNTAGLLLVGALSCAYTQFMVITWCCGILYVFTGDANPSNLLPRLIWSYGFAIGPWQYFAREESRLTGEGNWSAGLLVCAAQIAYGVVILLVGFWPISIRGATTVFTCFMAIELLLRLVIMACNLGERARTLQEQAQEYSESAKALS